MLIIPKIKISDGAILDSIFCEEKMKKYYDLLIQNPERLANLLRRENSKSLLFFDYDSYFKEDNSANLKAIANVVKTIDIPIQYVTRIHTIGEAEKLLDAGIYRIFVDDILLRQPLKLRELVNKYSPSRVATFFLFRYGKLIPTDKCNELSVQDWVDLAKDAGINRILYADKEILIDNKEFDFDKLFEFAKSTRMKITIVEGIHSSKLLRRFGNAFPPYIDSVAMGRALWENSFPCQKMWRMVEAELEKDNNVITTAGELKKNIW